ncbi:Uncharacterised protein [Serratia fonticola]|nr:hypothetical protein L581_1126 [Serratia fonticola AU-AP2C]PAA96123.1 hypothetical protein CJJ13_18950 [Serratia fonticola]CAI1204712.1 Uncharacterised protein [Serratia fonticola]
MNYQFTRLMDTVCKNIIKFSTDASLAADVEKNGHDIQPHTEERNKKTRPKPGFVVSSQR